MAATQHDRFADEDYGDCAKSAPLADDTDWKAALKGVKRDSFEMRNRVALKLPDK